MSKKEIPGAEKDQPQVMPYTRQEEMMVLGQEDPRPKLEWGSFLVRTLGLMGFFSSTDMGARGFSVMETSALIGIPDSPIDTWKEAVLLSKMSKEFLRGLKEGADPFSIPPWER